MAFRKILKNLKDSIASNSQEPATQLSIDTKEQILSASPTNNSSPSSELSIDSPATTDSKEKRDADREVNIERIKASRFYSSINDLVAALMLVDKAESSVPLSPTEQAQVNKFFSANSSSSPSNAAGSSADVKISKYVPRVRKSKKSEIDSQKYQAMRDDKFLLNFKYEDKDLSAVFLITNHPEVIVVLTEKDFKNIELFTQAYPAEVQELGFKKYHWVQRNIENDSPEAKPAPQNKPK
jgi:hypothetical protein